MARRHFSVRVNPGDDPRAFLLYYLYGLERTGRLTNQRFIGRHDWYREGAEWLINEQEDLSGFWKGTGLGENDPHIGTSLALLFLAKGRRPIVAAKIEARPAGRLEPSSQDLANLVTYTEKRWGRDLTWQVIDIDAANGDDLMERRSCTSMASGARNLGRRRRKAARIRQSRRVHLCRRRLRGRGVRPRLSRDCRADVSRAGHRLHLLPPEHRGLVGRRAGRSAATCGRCGASTSAAAPA